MSRSTIAYYWRPGCPFCMFLERSLAKLDLPLDRRNIWENDEHAATVRSIAGGNETVPTVVVGELALVNPSATQVLEAVASEAPELLPDDYEANEPSAVGRAINRLLGG